MPKVKALSNVKHDGVEYSRGDSLDVDAATAKSLTDAGVATTGKVEDASAGGESPFPGAKVEDSKLWDLSREKLNEEAHNRGFNNPEQFPKKAQLIEALTGHTEPTSDSEATSGNEGSDKSDTAED